MVVVKISDGLGNQMFQYAFGRSLAIKRGDILELDTTPFNQDYNLRKYLLEKFNINYSISSLLQKIKYRIIYKNAINKICNINFLFPNIFIEKKAYVFDKDVFQTDSYYFAGYWQDYRYFKDIRGDLFKEFTLKEKPNIENQNMLKNIKSTNAVSVHIRRGDFLAIDGQEVCSLEYYQKAIGYISSLVKNPVFYIFSDDITWAKKNLLIENPVKYIDFNTANPEWDLELMKNCKHNIVANSTFSWWGAWLNQNKSKIIIGPREWKVGCSTSAGFVTKDWILL